MFTIPFLLMKAHPDKMKYKEHSMSSSSEHRHELASASPKCQFLLGLLHCPRGQYCTVIRCTSCQRQTKIRIPGPHTIYAGWVTFGN